MTKWINQTARLSYIQKLVTFSVLWNDDSRNQSQDMALEVLNAHIHEDEDIIVRNLAYFALTSTNSMDCGIAISGLGHVSQKNAKISSATLLYYLNHVDVGHLDNYEAANLAFCLSGLLKVSPSDAVILSPVVQNWTNNQNVYLSGVAQDFLSKLNKASNGDAQH